LNPTIRKTTGFRRSSINLQETAKETSAASGYRPVNGTEGMHIYRKGDAQMTRIGQTLKLAAIGSALAVSSLALQAPALANDGERTEIVNYGDLDLTSQAGVDTLDRRLGSAVNRVCGGTDLRRLAYMIGVNDCRHDAHKGIAPQRDAAIAAARGELRPTVEISRNSDDSRIILIGNG
jgi:UrcA family protein